MAIVYLATNLINGKRYIGVTRRTLAHRRGQHINAAFGGRPKLTVFGAAIRKHGADIFDFRVLEEVDDYSTALSEEVRLIAALKPEYNMTLGGEGKLGLPGPFKGEKRDPETMRKIWNTKRERNSHRSASVVASAKMANEIVARQRSRPVICLDDGLSFPSISAAARNYGLVAINISLVCRNLMKTIGGKRFSYAGSASDVVRAPRPKGKPVVCIDDGNRFASAVAAALYYGLSPQLISHVCNGRRERTGGRCFRFEVAS